MKTSKFCDNINPDIDVGINFNPFLTNYNLNSSFEQKLINFKFSGSFCDFFLPDSSSADPGGTHQQYTEL